MEEATTTVTVEIPSSTSEDLERGPWEEKVIITTQTNLTICVG